MPLNHFNNKYFFFPFLVLVSWSIYMTSSSSFWVFSEGWKASLTMVFGSFIAGASSEGGGAVAFPVFTLLLDLPPSVARNFSFAIQSVGMTAASLIIIISKFRIEKVLILLSLFGGIPGLLIGTIYIEPSLSPKLTKLFFVSLWLSFGIILSLRKYSKKKPFYNQLPVLNIKEKGIIVCFGFLGGVITSFFGNGIDILMFCLTTLYFRLNVKISTTTSIIIMAVLSIFSFFFHLFFLKDFTGVAYNLWLSSVPIVVIFAPLGTLIVTYISKNAITNFLKLVILVQYIGAIVIINPSFNWNLFYSLSIVTLGVVLFSYISRQGEKRINTLSE